MDPARLERPDPEQPFVSATLVEKVYRRGEVEVRALDGVSFDIRRGEYVAVMGRSGSGKSTLLNLLGCLDRPTGGSITIDGVALDGLDSRELARFRNQSVGFVFQQFNLLPNMSALANVALPLLYGDCPGETRLAQARHALCQLGLEDRLDHFPNQMSGGQQQRVAIARATVTRPRLLLADEPTGALDSATSNEILDLLDAFNAAGTTLLLVTHDDAVAARADRILTLRDGRVDSAADRGGASLPSRGLSHAAR